MSSSRLARMDEVIEQAIARHETPGAVVLVARQGRIVWRKAYGSRSLVPAEERMTTDTIFDLASLTKVVATAASVMILIERGQLRLNDTAAQFIPELKGEGRELVTIEQLLTHRTGFAPDFDLSERWSGYDEAIRRLGRERLRAKPGTRFVYSDLNYIILGEIVHRVSGMMLDEFSRKNIYEPLGMRDTGFRPRAELRPRIAPTERLRGSMSYLGGSGAESSSAGERVLRGEVHDPTSFRMGGVAGHAGLFSTADDLAIFCQMILQGGEYGGVRILSPMTVAAMTRPRAVTDDGSARGLGWDIATSFSSNRGDIFPLGSFGHTGFTGTSIWIDPATQSFVIFLSNRVHPDGRGDVVPLRGKVASIVASSITNTTADRAREESARYASELMATLARAQATSAQQSASIDQPLDVQVLTGIDVLERDRFGVLKGLRIGLVTNQTGRDRAGRSTIDVLHDAEGVKLVALFSPEHGIRGASDERVSDSRDERTGLPIYSLYGETRRPTQEQMRDMDAFVFDIQDVGTRFYTYISTLGYVMEEAARAHKPVFVLDRPNPINGVDVEGPLADANRLSFTAYHAMPVRHGMTVGELAQLFNQERSINCDLRVVKMEGWRRVMWFDSTGLTWVNPSPNMRSLTEAALYPGVGLLETTNLSVGRGTNTPFELVGAPWLDGARLSSYLNERRIEGVRFVPVRFTPVSSVFKTDECGGVNIIITNRSRFRSVQTGLEIAAALRRLYPTEWKIDDYSRLIVNAETLERLKQGESPEEIAASWREQLERFNATRAKYLLYK
ncbi:MAG TPA: exo-beta-N-acetylmuramidase NamZ domain-containing protein [Pyrinomonadaceae bacterium]|nr:exo-beta-N-acetylmuramidase NamZ domain-containing protein [Pyrinomonadaceae bacterium]